MKGIQGLEALAALCGGATQAKSENAQGASAAAQSGGGSSTAAGPPAPTPQAAQASPSVLPNVNPQQLQQMMATAAYGSGAGNPIAAMMQAAAVAGVSQNQPDMASFNAMQPLAYYQYMQIAQAAAMQAQMSGNWPQAQPQQVQSAMQAPKMDLNKAVAAFSYPGQAVPVDQKPDTSNRVASNQQSTPQSQQQQANTKVTSQDSSSPANSGSNSMPPPSKAPATHTMLSTNELILSNTATASLPSAPVANGTPQKLAMIKPPQTAIAQRPTPEAATVALAGQQGLEDKKQLKRAANRRSAQLSRKRKKAFIDDLREENNELRRKEQILKSIPDLIVVFDSSGRLWFVSHSVSRFLDFTPRELEGTSFWDRLCDGSVRLLKAAFMDALAARNDSNAAPLGSGVWELRLVDKDGSHKVVTLNGVVHFSGSESPECVCSIRPREEIPAEDALPAHHDVTLKSTLQLRPPIKPQQSVISGSSSDDGQIVREKVRARRPAQISDGDSGSIISESGSDESR